MKQAPPTTRGQQQQMACNCLMPSPPHKAWCEAIRPPLGKGEHGHWCEKSYKPDGRCASNCHP